MQETPSQTAGPYLHIGMMDAVGPAQFGSDLRGGRAQGSPVTLVGRVTDGDGAAVTDALLEIWQPDAHGLFPGEPDADPNFAYLGRAACDEDGRYRFETIRPGAVSGSAPYIAMMLYARGVNRGLHLRCYFDGDRGNADDPLLSKIDAARRATLIAQQDGDMWRLDIALQGDKETVFLDV